MMPTPSNILALDVGGKRVGVAIASTVARLPRPLTTLQRGDNFFDELRKVIEAEKANAIVIGLPRGLDGQETPQTKITTEFIEELRNRLDLSIHLQDEALTSKKAEAELQSRGSEHSKGDVDALAATYILEDFLNGYNGIE